MSHPKIEMSERPRAMFTDTNRNGVLDDDDIVTVVKTDADGRTVPEDISAGTFAMVDNRNRNLVIQLAQSQRLNTSLFAANHPLKK